MNKLNSTYVSSLALVLSLIAVTMCALCCFGGGKSDSNVEQTLMDKPEIIVNAMQNYEKKMRDEAAAQSTKLIAENIDAINNNPNSPILANPDGKIILVEFFDYACGYCHRLYPAIQSIIAKNPNVKVITKELAFVSPNSDYAGRAALAVKKQGKYVDFHKAMMESSEPLTEASVEKVAEKIGVNVAQMKVDMNSEEIKSLMKANGDLAQKIQINGVPSLVLNGKMLQTIDEGVIQSEIDNIK